MVRLASLPLAACILATVAASASAAPPDTAWPAYNNGLDSQRFSPLSQIDASNVGKLAKVCSLKLGDDGPFQSGPLVIDDTLYVTTSHTTVALSATDCTVRWRNVYTADELESWPVNRGVAYLDGRIFRGTPDARVIALDSKTGKELWRTKVGEPTKGESVPSAPVAWDGKVFMGMANGDFGTRGRMLALDANSGAQLWKFDTVAVDDEKNADSWKRKASAATGGGATWSSYTIDTETGEIFIPVGNPSPALAPGYRPGANLYTDSLLVLDAKTGGLKWYYQLIPNDRHDWDLGATAALYADKNDRKIALVGNKDGYAYAIDRASHQLVFKTPITTIKNGDAPITPQDTLVCPGYVGGVEWNGPAYDASRKTAYLGSVDWCATYHSGEVTLADGRPDLGGVFEPVGKASGWVTALDGTTGADRWRYHADAPVVAGVTPTAGGIVLTGDISGNLLALDSGTGKLLLKTPVGGSMAGGVITYAVGGTQYVAFTSGNLSKFTFAGSTGTPTIVVYGVDQPARGDHEVEGLAAAANVPLGQKVYSRACVTCHGVKGEGSVGPKLAGIAERLSVDQIVAQIKKPKGSMPTLYPAMITSDEMDAVAKYVEAMK
jgi:alcohol dehydrogenase (cytochrome c)